MQRPSNSHLTRLVVDPLWLLGCFSPIRGRGGLTCLMNGEGVAVRVEHVGCKAPALFARLLVLEPHTLPLQVSKDLAAVINLKHPTRADARHLMTSRQPRVRTGARLPKDHFDGLSLRANR